MGERGGGENFDKESKSFFFFFLGGGGGGGEGRGGGFQPKKRKYKKTLGIRYFFVLMLYIIFKVPGSSGSLILTKIKEVTDRHNSANVLQNSVKSHLNMDSKQSSEFQDPSSSNSLHIVLTRFFYFYKS